jgi:hypothetical protein
MTTDRVADLERRVERMERAVTNVSGGIDDLWTHLISITPPAAPAPEPENDAEKWDRLSQFIVSHSQYGELPNAQEIIAKAIALGLAAPADRAELARWAKSYKDDDEGDPNVLNVLASFLRERSRGIGWYDAMDFALSLHEPPADRVVCAVDNTAIDGATRVHGNHTAMGATPRQAMHEALDYVAGYWTGTAPAGADTEGEK